MDDIRVILAEDSPTVRRHLAKIINDTPGMCVVGEAKDGLEVISLVEQMRPDVVSMDISMPRLDGLEATRHIMSRCPTPIVVVSGMLDTDIQLSFRALQSGALAVVEKPPDRANPKFARMQRELVMTLQAMSDVSVVSRRRTKSQFHQNDSQEFAAVRVPIPVKVAYEVIAVGTSTGGPSALSKFLRDLPGDLPVPVVIVQHMTDEFLTGLARWLDNTSELSVVVAEDRKLLEPGVVYLAPGSAHLTLARRGSELGIRLVEEQGPHRYRPSVDVLFESVAAVCKESAIGCILTGMGDDGAAGLLSMRNAGALTFAQDEMTSTVFGMPAVAIEKGAAQYVVSITDLANEILKII